MIKVDDSKNPTEVSILLEKPDTGVFKLLYELSIAAVVVKKILIQENTEDGTEDELERAANTLIMGAIGEVLYGDEMNNLVEKERIEFERMKGDRNESH